MAVRGNRRRLGSNRRRLEVDVCDGKQKEPTGLLRPLSTCRRAAGSSLSTALVMFTSSAGMAGLNMKSARHACTASPALLTIVTTFPVTPVMLLAISVWVQLSTCASSVDVRKPLGSAATAVPTRASTSACAVVSVLEMVVCAVVSSPFRSAVGSVKRMRPRSSSKEVWMRSAAAGARVCSAVSRRAYSRRKRVCVRDSVRAVVWAAADCTTGRTRVTRTSEAGATTVSETQSSTCERERGGEGGGILFACSPEDRFDGPGGVCKASGMGR